MSNIPGFVQVDIGPSVGALLAGTWLNSGLFSIELIQMYSYFTKTSAPFFSPLKLGMALLLMVDLASTLGDYACVWLYAIAHWGDQIYLSNQYWPIPLYLITTGISAAFMQGFLLLRLYRLSRNVVLSVAIIPVMLAALGGAISVAALVIIFPGYTDRHHLNTSVTVWLVSSAAADVIIALALIMHLNKVRKTAAKFEQSQLTSTMGRLMRVAVETGSVTSAGAILIVSLYLANPEENISTGICFGLGRAYSLTLLFNLNTTQLLQRQHAQNSDGATDGGVISKRAGFGLAGITVGHQTTVQIEDADPIKLEDLREFARMNKEPKQTTFEIGKPHDRSRDDEKDSWDREV